MGFDLNGDGTSETGQTGQNGPGNFVCFDKVSEATAKKINDILDKGVPENADEWKSKGKVEYQADGIINIYLIGGRGSS
jgi:hypothetical protein